MTTIELNVDGNHLVGLEAITPTYSLYLGRERLATDADDRDLTGTMRMFSLHTAVAPGEWPCRGTAAAQLANGAQ